MTVPLDAPDGSDQQFGSRPDGMPDPAEGPHYVAPPSAPEATSAMCPYLTSAGGAWRHATPSRDHRCGALEPPAPQTADKQRRHCLSAHHMECPTFRAARTGRAATLILSGDPATVEAIDAARRPIARTAPILLEEPRLIDQAVRLRFDRGPGQLALVGLMILAFAVVAITRLSTGSAPGANGSAGPSGLAEASPSPSPTVEATPSSSPEVSPSAVPASAEPSFRTTYTVQKGDTLTTIAARFKTTAIAIRRLNQLTGSTIHTGQVLKIP